MPPGETQLPREPVQRITAPIDRFLHVEAASGVVLLVAAAVAFVAANTSAAEAFLGFWKTHLSFGFGAFQMDHSLKHWVSDGLMAIFFFVVGLEVKRELVLGELRELRKAALPIAGALGGMIVPAGIYLALLSGDPAARGWGIPMATDIAFVVGCMAVLGRRAPSSLRIFVLSLAIADDIGAILVIAIGYTEDLNLTALMLGGAGLVLVLLFQRLGVRAIGVYGVLAVGIWVAFHESGVHATIAGVILGLLTPARSWVSDERLAGIARQAGDVWRGDGWEGFGSRRALLQRVQTAAREALSPLERLENGIHPWSAFLIMPIFALANAGVVFEATLVTDPVALAVAAGLVVGKPVGILMFSYAAVRLGLASLPEGMGWSTVIGGGFLAGIGFTMSLFISGLALEGGALDAAKVGVLGASLLSGALGMTLLVAFLPGDTENGDTETR
jgi:NhaA family Na+:H+ antiporter